MNEDGKIDYGIKIDVRTGTIYVGKGEFDTKFDLTNVNLDANDATIEKDVQKLKANAFRNYSEIFK